MRIIVVDDHALVRRAMKHVVQEGFPAADVVEADGTAAALELMGSAPVDIALVDVRMPDRDGLELLRAIKLDWSDVPVIMVSNYDDAAYVRRALGDGAAGYLVKDATPEDLARAINVAISGGGNVLSPRVIQNLFEDVESTGPSGLASGRHRTDHTLTQREHGVLELLAEGKSKRGIAQSLFLSEKTVKAHLAAVFRKLGVSNRTQAAMVAVQMGIGPVHSGLTVATRTDELLASKTDSS